MSIASLRGFAVGAARVGIIVSLAPEGGEKVRRDSDPPCHTHRWETQMEEVGRIARGSFEPSGAGTRGVIVAGAMA